MNFGKHGRTILMSALLAATSTVVFAGMIPGVASAAAGTIKVGGFPADNSGNGNDPHISTSCVGIRLFDMDLSKPLTATFSLQAPTKGSPAEWSTSATADGGVLAVDVAKWLSAMPASKQGYHVSVNVDGKQKTFWVDSLSTGCPKPAPTCSSAPLFGATVPANAETTPLLPGQTITATYVGAAPLPAGSVTATLDGQPTTTVVVPDGTVTDILVALPNDLPAQPSPHALEIKLPDLNHACSNSTVIHFTSVPPAYAS